ncbi:hypothetical protein ACE7GA_24430 [Roseomonas sp. CCTCC AB2023176]|uniref:hypothetical protein n=1 Tax=Roseomonas sp. CCTCC AB2023176 TaxID=3342640 RepID=UPI0035DBAC3F
MPHWRTPRRLAGALALGLALSGCAGGPAGQVDIPIPPRAAAGPYSPAANVISGAAEAFASPARLAGHPAEAAIAVARLEWLAESVPRNLEFTNYSPITGPALQAARFEVRGAVGIAPDAPAAVVVPALDRAADALLRGDAAGAEAALPAPVFAPGTVARLATLPRLPQANAATRRAQRDLEFGRDEWDISALQR